MRIEDLSGLKEYNDLLGEFEKLRVEFVSSSKNETLRKVYDSKLKVIGERMRVLDFYKRFHIYSLLLCLLYKLFAIGFLRRELPGWRGGTNQ